MNFVYTVPIIPQNLRREETIVQIADALNYLSEVSSDIFSRVDSRIEANRTRLLSLSNRIDAARVKISKLTGAKKATQVFSSSKYPASDVHRQYKSVFDDKKLAFTRSKVKYKDIQVKDEPIETLQFYHVKVCDIGDLQHIDGLGELPVDMKSINDLLLYNSGKNPYEKYVMSDPLQASLRMKKDDIMDISDIGAAPHSISERTTLTRSATESYFYSPDLGDVPSIDVPLDLPDLPGIADDLRYIDELGQGIAPSVTTTPNIPDFPLLNGPMPQPIDSEIEPLLLPPLPLIQEEIPVANVTVTNESCAPVEPKTSEPSSIQLQPESQSDTNLHQIDNSLTKPPIVQNDAHASLMEAIRKAGGSKKAKLKQAAEPKNLSVVPGGDLMADLHAKLSLRRKGISGAKNQDNLSGLDTGSAMNKVSAMIPPPPTKIEAESTATEDEDWDE